MSRERSRPATRWAEQQSAADNASLPSILADLGMKMVLCCCWPVHKCVTVLSCFDTLIVAICAYKTFGTLADTIYEPHWTSILAFLYFFSFLVCQLIATVLVILAQKRQLAHYCLPRLVLLCGLVITSAIAWCIVLFYLAGATTKMNEFFFGLFEWFFSEELDERERIELKHELRLYAIAFLLLAVVFCVYSLVELWLTKKFHSSLNEFRPVSQQEPTAPHPAYNPDYGAPPAKVYPNLA